MSLQDCVIAVEEWYDRQTGKPAPLSRTLNIMLAIEKFMSEVVGFPAVHYSYAALLDRVELKVVSDPLWTERRNRMENEKHGVLVGTGKNKGKPEFWYLVPKDGSK